MVVKTLLAVALVFPLMCHAAGSDQKVYLSCKPDANEKLPGGIDVLLDKATLDAVFVQINEKRKFQESETDYITRDDFNGKPAFVFAINKFTLRYRSFNVANALVSADPSVAGQCTVKEKRL